MRYRQRGKRQTISKAWKAEECIYCPLKKPIAWPIVFLLFAFSPFIFSNPTLKKPSPHSPNNEHPASQLPPSQETNRVLPDQPAHLPAFVSHER